MKNHPLESVRIPVGSCFASLWLGLTLVAHTATAQTSFDGARLRLLWNYPALGTDFVPPRDIVVWSGPEALRYPSGGECLDLDIASDSIVFDFRDECSWTGGAFNGPRIIDSSNSLAPFLRVTVDTNTTLAGFGQERVTVSPNEIRVNLQGLKSVAGDVLKLNVIFSRPDLVPNIRVSIVDICWPGFTNKTYQIQYAQVIPTNTWSNLGPPVPGNGTNCISDTAYGPERRFYRVLEVP